MDREGYQLRSLMIRSISALLNQLTVTISKIEIRKAGANEGDPFIELLMNPVTIDIFQLRNGITEELVNLEVPQGDYDLVRLYVDEANLKLKDPE